MKSYYILLQLTIISNLYNNFLFNFLISRGDTLIKQSNITILIANKNINHINRHLRYHNWETKKITFEVLSSYHIRGGLTRMNYIKSQ